MPQRAESLRVLFVCLGNICRSPMAEFIVRRRAIDRGLGERYHFASAGTGDWHIGHGADRRMLQTAASHGIDLAPHRASQITRGRVAQWDWLVAMDRSNRYDLLAMGADEGRTLMMRCFENRENPPDVPDPYYGGDQGFEEVFRLLSLNADPLLDYLNSLTQR